MLLIDKNVLMFNTIFLNFHREIVHSRYVPNTKHHKPIVLIRHVAVKQNRLIRIQRVGDRGE